MHNVGGKDYDMENNSTGAVFNGGESGSAPDAFEMFQNGASIDDINEMLFPSSEDENLEERAESNNADRDDSEIDAGDDSSFDGIKPAKEDEQSREGVRQVLSAEEAFSANEDKKTDAAANAESKEAEKKFTQADLDSIAGRVRQKEKGARDRLDAEYRKFREEVAGLLGVDPDNALEALRTEKLKREAEESGFEDSQLYLRARNAEIELEKMRDERDAATRDVKQRVFLDDVEKQLNDYHDAHPDVDIVSISSGLDFNRMLRMFYANENTRERCVEYAVNAFSPPVKNLVDAGDEENTGDEKRVDQTDVRKSVEKQNRRRQAESVSSSKAHASGERFDYDSMKAEDFEKIRKRLEGGEKMYF